MPGRVPELIGYPTHRTAPREGRGESINGSDRRRRELPLTARRYRSPAPLSPRFSNFGLLGSRARA